MTRTPPCCCNVEEKCALLFMRVKRLEDTPVFSTPDVTFWTKKFIGYTGMSGGWFFGANGTTGCTCSGVTLNLDGITVSSNFCNNIGIDPEYKLDKIKFLANIPGDNINWYGKQIGIAYTPLIVVMGALILPTDYEGITLNNSIKENNSIYYQFTKGILPKSLTPFVFDYFDCTKLYNRDELQVLIIEGGYTGATAGTNDNQISKFKVYYSDDITTAIKSSKDIFFSVDKPANIPEGYWFREGDETGGSPLVINGHCFQEDLRGCNSIPYAYFQTIPEQIYMLNVNISKCKNDAGDLYISVTDTTLAHSFSLQKAIIDSDGTCLPGITCLDTLRDDKTVGSLVCTAWNDVGIPACPIENIGKGRAYGDPDCKKAPEVPCSTQDGPCQSVDCNLYEPQTFIIEFIKRTSIYDYNICGCFDSFCAARTNSERVVYNGTFLKSEYEPYINCGKKIGRDDDADGCGYWKDYYEYECITYEIQQDKCKRIDYSDLINSVQYQRDWGFDPTTGEPYDTGPMPLEPISATLPSVLPTYYRPGYGVPIASCCCCQNNYEQPEYMINACCGTWGICNTTPEYGNAIIVKIPSETVFIPNPYLMYTNNSAYFSTIEGISLPNFGKYIKYYRDVWVSDRLENYSNAGSYIAYAKNPQCGLTVAKNAPDYFLFNESSFLELNPPVTTKNCTTRYKRLPNYDIFCKNVYGIKNNYKNYVCKTNIKHKKLQDFSFKLACNEKVKQGLTYGSSDCWKLITKYWQIEGITYQGICDNKIQELIIQMPKGITLNDCTDILSRNVLINAPKTPLF